MPLAALAPRVVGAVTLAVGAGLLVRPRLATAPLGLPSRERELRAIGVADLVAGYGLLRGGTPAWPWMAARASLNVVMLVRVGEGRRAFAVLTALDGGTALALRGLGS